MILTQGEDLRRLEGGLQPASDEVALENPERQINAAFAWLQEWRVKEQ